MTDLQVFYEATPNPQSLKFNVTQPMATEVVNFTTEFEARRSPLAQKIMGFPWAASVFIGPNFVTVTKQEWVEWEVLADPLAELIKEHVQSGEPVLLAATEEPSISNDISEDDPPVVKAIKKVLAEEIRPAVAMDGGDIVFERFENGRVYLQMHGACSGCPSSMFTLKEGVETRLRATIPEVVEVVPV